MNADSISSNSSTLIYARLMQCAPDASLLVLAMGGCLARAWAQKGLAALPVIGLSAVSTRRALAHCFPGAERVFALDWAQLARQAAGFPGDDEIEDIVTLLREHAAADDDEHCWVAHLVATGCSGERHLWEDMGLPSRRELSALLERYFPALAARNTADMKWKKFFYKQLCDRAELPICRSPSCAVCSDYENCFGPEEATAGMRGQGLALPVYGQLRGTPRTT